jgi:hypothetical protein
VGLDIAQYLDASEEVEHDWHVPIAHLSASSLGMLARCPEQWRQRYVLGRKERPGEALVIGTAVHVAAEHNFTQKIESHADLIDSELIQWYDDVAFPQAVNERQEKGEEVRWDTDPDGARLRGKAITKAYHAQVAPRIQPLSVETKVEADFGLPIPVIGFADVFIQGRVIDIKTGKAARREPKPEWWIQAALYGTITNLPLDFHCVSATTKEHRATVNTPLQYPDLSVWLPEPAQDEAKRYVRSMGWMANHFMVTLGPDSPWPTWGRGHPWACNWCAFKVGCPAWEDRRSTSTGIGSSSSAARLGLLVGLVIHDAFKAWDDWKSRRPSTEEALVIFRACNDHAEFVSLDDDEIDFAIRRSRRKYQQGDQHDKHGWSGWEREVNGHRMGWRNQALGGHCEQAAAKALNVYPYHRFNDRFSQEADLPYDIEVKLIGRDYYGLRIYDKIPDHFRVVGVIIEPGKERGHPLRLPGWIRAEDGKRIGHLLAPHGMPPFRAVAQSDLLPLDMLRVEIANDMLRDVAARLVAA